MANQEKIDVIEKELMIFYPNTYVPKFIFSTRDIFENRFILKQIKFDNNALNYLLDLLIKDINEKRRFRKADCLKVIKSIMKSKNIEKNVESRVIKKLFYLYKKFIFDGNEEVQWTVSIFIKNQILEDRDIFWLIKNYKRSAHIINRLLLYPQNNNLIFEWAKKIYLNGELEDRVSEVMGVLLKDEFPSFIDVTDSKKIMWAIYYSKSLNITKESLIKKYFSLECLDTAIDVSKRLGYVSVIEFILNELRGRTKGKKGRS